MLFAAAVLAINAHWWRVPITEGGDFAANSLQVYHAKVFRELLGNYSRWQFHHPGPVYFYLFAAGEYLFYDLLHIVPAPANAQFLTVLLVNTALLFGSIEIFARHFSERAVSSAGAGRGGAADFRSQPRATRQRAGLAVDAARGFVRFPFLRVGMRVGGRRPDRAPAARGARRHAAGAPAHGAIPLCRGDVARQHARLWRRDGATSGSTPGPLP